MTIQSLSADELELGAQLVDGCLQRDRHMSDLRWKLKLGNMSIPSVSGLADADYPQVAALNGVREFVASKRLSIPQELVDQFSHMQCSCSMGLFSIVSRAWLTIDSDLFVWNYETNDDLAYFDGLPNAILKMELARPKMGVFQSHIHYVLVVATTSDVVLLAVSFSNANGQPVASQDYKQSEMHLMPEPLFKIPLEGAVVTDIISTLNGRIFFTSKDGCIYEIEYQDRGWFGGRQCKKINHSKGLINYLIPFSFVFGKDSIEQVSIDESRHILFTRSLKGSIQVFDLGIDGRQMSRIAQLSSDQIEYNASLICNTVDPTNYQNIVYISAISSSQSQPISLIAITELGVRLFFSCYYPSTQSFIDQSDQMQFTKQSEVRPQTLSLVHIRLPPGFSACSTVGRPINTHIGYFISGLSIFASCSDEESDVIWALSESNFPFRQDLIENLNQLPVRGRIWAIAESTNDFDVETYERAIIRQGDSSLIPVRPPLIVYQHIQQPKQIIVLSAQGIQIIEHRRPVDILRCLLLDFGADSRQIIDFFQLHDAKQACAMCLTIICTSSLVDGNVHEAALRAFFLYGGDPTMASFAPNAEPMSPPPTPHLDWSRNGSIADWSHNIRSPLQSSTPQQSPENAQYKRTINTFNGTTNSPSIFAPSKQPVSPDYDINMADPLSPMVTSSRIKFSHRHDAMYLGFARIVGPLWDMRLCIERNNNIESAFLSDELNWLTKQLTRYKEVIDQHSLIPRPAYPIDRIENGGHLRAQLSKKYIAEAVNAERQSLMRLYELVTMAGEMLSLWKIVTDHQFNIVVAQLPTDIQRMLVDIRFANLIINGKNLCCDLITCLIRQYLGDRATTNAISERLRKVCPSLYSSDDAIAAKATELLQQARTLEDDTIEKQQLMKESVDMFRSVVQRIHLPTVCLQFQNAQNFGAIVDLVLAAAEKADPQHLALTAYKNTEPLLSSDDSIPNRLLNSRNQCYVCITDALNQMTVDGGGVGTSALNNRLSEHVLAINREKIINSILASNDELAHVALFKWMLERKLTDEMLRCKSPFFENYLQHEISRGGGHCYLDLLWRFYEKQGRYMQAAQLLYKLAQRHSAQADLRQRISYLSHSVLCAQSATDANSVENAEFVQELRDKLDVARIQLQTRDAITQIHDRDRNIQQALQQLNGDLYDVTELYEQFAERFDLADIKLAIVHCAGHCDQPLIESLWMEIIEKELISSQQHESADVRSKRLTTKLIQICKLYSNSPRFFPADFICRLLQRKSFECDFSPVWLPSIVNQLGIGDVRLIDSLGKQYRSRDPLWKTNRHAQLHLMHAAIHIAEQFAQNANEYSVELRRCMKTKCLDMIALFVIEMQTPAASAEFIRLRQRFQTAQTIIERIHV